jgi:hypothetical protein
MILLFAVATTWLGTGNSVAAEEEMFGVMTAR